MKNLKQIFCDPVIWVSIALLIASVAMIWIWFLAPDAFTKIKTENSEPNSIQEIQVHLAQVPKIEIKVTAAKNEIEEDVPHFQLSDYERWVVESIVAGEAGDQSLEGKQAVANCIVNACIKDGLLPSEVREAYQYSGWKRIEKFESECMKAYGNTKLSDEVREAVKMVFDEGELLDKNILWFCSSYSAWHERQRFVFEIQDHRFFAPWN